MCSGCGWRRLDLLRRHPPTGTSKRSISELHFHARRGVEIEISLMLNSCALHGSRIGCALLGHVSATLPRASPRSADRTVNHSTCYLIRRKKYSTNTTRPAPREYLESLPRVMRFLGTQKSPADWPDPIAISDGPASRAGI